MENIKEKLLAKIIDPSVTTEKLQKAFVVLTNEQEMECKESGCYLSDIDACEYAGGIAHSTLWKWRKNGLPSYQVGGRRLYRSTDIDKFIIQSNRGKRSY